MKPLSSLAPHVHLLSSLVKRDIERKYRGSFLGVVWSIVTPVTMLLVYTFVFSVVFQAKWGASTGSKMEFAAVLFIGLLVFNFFADVVNKSPTMIIENTNYVKRVVFPIEILPLVAVGTASFHLAIGAAVWLLFYLFAFGVPSPHALLFPIVLLPLLPLTAGLSWMIASLGVYLRDIQQLVSTVVMVLMFLSPVFYPVSALPGEFQAALYLNPLTLIMEHSRAVLYWGEIPSFSDLFKSYALAVAVAVLGAACFQYLRKGFSDVL